MYLLDSNVFMEASRFYYGFAIAPGFWEWLEREFAAKHVASVRSVYDEIKAGSGDLVDWSKAQSASFWLPETDGSVEAAARVSAWVVDPARIFKPAAKRTFLGSTDLHLVAQAIATGATVVTREVSEPMSQKSVKIPDVCNVFGVEVTQPFEVFRELGLQLTA